MRRALRILLCVALLVGARAAWAQPAAAPALDALAASEKAAAAKTIAIGDLPRRLAEEGALIERIVARSTAPAESSEFPAELRQFGSNIDALGRRLAGKEFDALPLSGLESLERHLVFLDRKLAQLQDDLQSAIRPLSEGAGELAQRRKVWRDARQASLELMPAALLANIDALDAQFERAIGAVARPLAVLLAGNQEVGALRARVAERLQTVREQIALSAQRLWRPDSANLLRVIGNAGLEAEGTLQAVLAGYAIQAEFSKEFDRAQRRSHALLALAGIVALPLFVWLARRARAAIDADSALERYRATLARPFSVWLLVVVSCWLLVDADGPYLRRATLLAVAWLPAMRLQPQWVDAAIGRWKYATIAYFVIGALGLLVSTYPLIFRPILLLNGLLLCAAFAGLLTHPPRSGDAARRWRGRLALALSGGYLLAVGTAVVANVVGCVRLAVLLTEAAIGSLYLVFFLLAVRQVVGAYVQVLRAAGALSRRTEHATRLFEALFTLFNFALLVVWLIGTLSVFRVLRLLKSELAALAAVALELGSFSVSVGGVVVFCVSVLLSFWIARTVRAILADDVLPEMTLPRGVANSVSTMSYYALLLLGLLVAVSIAGVELSQLALVLGALSVGIGFGLNTVVNNFVCGLILMLERPIQPGDSIEFSGTTGKIRDIGIRTTTLATFDGADVMIPNGLLLADKLTNWTFNNERRRVEVAIGVAYGSALRPVQALLLEVAGRVPGVSADPPPTALFTGFGQNSLDFCVRVWSDDFDQSATVRSELAIEIYDALRAAGIEIPFPQREVHIRSVDAVAIAALSPPAA